MLSSPAGASTTATRMSSDTATDGVQIVDFSAKYADDFKRLNYEWIEQHFEIEQADRDALENPQEKILNRGGHIFIALADGAAVGACALIRHNRTTFELAKMAVAKEARGKRIGWRLGKAIVRRAKDLGGETLYLESNSVLKPALRLYEKLGFSTVTGLPTPYSRCNVQMTLSLNEA